MTDTLDHTEARPAARPVKRPAPDTLYITDAELIRRMGVPEKIARANIRALDAKRTDFPKKDQFWGGRRYWPAVKAWLDRNSGLKMDAPQPRRTP